MNRDLSKFEPPKTEPDGLTKELFGLPPMKRTPAKKSERGKELVEIVRCKNCIHRPIKGEDTHDIDPPKDSRGYGDYTCPCLNEDDYWYSWYPSDDWFCPKGEVKGDEDAT